MIEILLKILKSETMYYVAIPLIVVFLNWIKNGYDVYKRNKELGYWELKCRKLPTFLDIIMKMYLWMAINSGIMQGIRIGLSLWKSEIYSYILTGIMQLAVNLFIVFLICRDKKIKIEFWTNGTEKKILIGALYVIYGVAFFAELFIKFKYVIELAFTVSLIVWIFFLFKYSDVAFILDNRYADIYIKGSNVAEFAEAGSMDKRGEWVIVNRYINDYDEEIRIKESDIVRIDYYGGPMIAIAKRKLFGWR